MERSSCKVICYGEILWDILPTGALPGGAPMNVAYHLQQLGIPSALITKIGNDKYGRDLIELYTKKGVSIKYQVDKDHATGLVYANEGDHHEMSYDIVFPSAWDFIEYEKDYGDVVSQAGYFVFGTLASRNDVSGNTLLQLLEHAHTKVFDINLRPPHFERHLIEELLKKTNILKMNLSELELVTNWFEQKGSTTERMQFVQDQFRIDKIIVTKGGDGAMVNDGGEIYRHPGYKVQVKDTIGSGDSFLAAFLTCLLKGENSENALDFASAVGAFVATKPGGSPDYELHNITKFMKGQKNG